MEVPEPRYATTADGTHIAYTVMGDGPIDLVYAFGTCRTSTPMPRCRSTRRSGNDSPLSSG
jgi:hypothetical protein